MPKTPIFELSLKFIILIFQLHLPSTNELMCIFYTAVFGVASCGCPDQQQTPPMFTLGQHELLCSLETSYLWKGVPVSTSFFINFHNIIWTIKICNHVGSKTWMAFVRQILNKLKCLAFGVFSTLFNNPNCHRTVESLVMTCSENGPDLFQANLNSLLFGKYRGLWTKE